MVGYTQGLKNIAVPEKLTLEEAIGVFEIWKEQQVFGRGVSSLLFPSVYRVPPYHSTNRVFSPQRNSSMMRPSWENTPNPEEMREILFGKDCSQH